LIIQIELEKIELVLEQQSSWDDTIFTLYYLLTIGALATRIQYTSITIYDYVYTIIHRHHLHNYTFYNIFQLNWLFK